MPLTPKRASVIGKPVARKQPVKPLTPAAAMPTDPPPDDVEWALAMVLIPQFNSKEQRVGEYWVDGTARGGIIYHRSRYTDAGGKSRPCWAVTSLHTGLAACLSVETEGDALRVATVLWDYAWRAFDFKTKGEIAAALPPWAKPWLQACQRERKYLRPEPFMGGA